MYVGKKGKVDAKCPSNKCKPFYEKRLGLRCPPNRESVGYMILKPDGKYNENTCSNWFLNKDNKLGMNMGKWLNLNHAAVMLMEDLFYPL